MQVSGMIEESTMCWRTPGLSAWISDVGLYNFESLLAVGLYL
jgi:hypothetical protein